MFKPVTACGHEEKIFQIHTRDKIVKRAVDVLQTWSKHFDAIAISGYSSAMVVPIIADKLKKNIVLVRKPSEVRNSDYNVEGEHNQRVLFFDDLISTGDTIRRIHDGLKLIKCKMVGLYLYESPTTAKLIPREFSNIIKMQRKNKVLV